MKSFLVAGLWSEEAEAALRCATGSEDEVAAGGEEIPEELAIGAVEKAGQLDELPPDVVAPVTFPLPLFIMSCAVAFLLWPLPLSFAVARAGPRAAKSRPPPGRRRPAHMHWEGLGGS